ncbi:MAG TPA: hypothetical protein VHE78_02455 [Gemmatimonadaceae bacterium]|nr:hypothetical protein [Gemmatimonadaceae bacterium]
MAALDLISLAPGKRVQQELMVRARERMLPPGTLRETQELELHHFIQSQERLPEYRATLRPIPREAELLHWADQASANGDIFHEAVEDRELFPGKPQFSLRRSRKLDRKVWRRPHGWE